MAVHKALARLVDSARRTVGEGRAYLHLRQAADQRQEVQGTLSLDWWDDDAVAPLSIEMDEPAGTVALPLLVERDTLSGCVVGRILRYQTTWPGQPAR